MRLGIVTECLSYGTLLLSLDKIETCLLLRQVAHSPCAFTCLHASFLGLWYFNAQGHLRACRSVEAANHSCVKSVWLRSSRLYGRVHPVAVPGRADVWNPGSSSSLCKQFCIVYSILAWSSVLCRISNPYFHRSLRRNTFFPAAFIL